MLTNVLTYGKMQISSKEKVNKYGKRKRFKN